LLGLLQQDPEDWFKRASGQEIDKTEIERLIEERTQARANKDFARADELRGQLADMGITVEDLPTGTIWRIAD
jgi:cysteinyl-tRNA synthetase